MITLTVNVHCPPPSYHMKVEFGQEDGVFCSVAYTAAPD